MLWAMTLIALFVATIALETVGVGAVSTRDGLMEDGLQKDMCAEEAEYNALLQTSHAQKSPMSNTLENTYRAEEGCGVEEFSAELLLTKNQKGLTTAPVPPGTADNINTSIPLDFTGIWWISWTNHPLMWWYDRLGIEMGWTFVGMTSNTTGEPWFPAEVHIPSGQKNRWMYTDSLPSKLGMYFKSSSNPFGTLSGTFFNSTHGLLNSPSPLYSWPIYKTDNDTWQRPTAFNSGITVTYTLKRIVYANGEPSRYWDAFVRNLAFGTFGQSPWKLRVYGSNDACMRECQTKSTIMFDALALTCAACKSKCNVSST